MEEYIIEQLKTTIIVTYSKGGGLKKVIAKKGFVTMNIMELIPFNKKEFTPESLALLKPYAPQKDPFVNEARIKWLEAYKKQTGIMYRFQAKDGAALKSIGKHLAQVSDSTEQALLTWRYLLNNWHTLPAFYQNSPDLTFINSQLNKILNLLKNGQQTSSQPSHNAADDLRSGFAT